MTRDKLIKYKAILLGANAARYTQIQQQVVEQIMLRYGIHWSQRPMRELEKYGKSPETQAP